MLSINGFIEARKQKAAAERERYLEGAVIRRDVMGPHYKGSVRRKDVKVLNEAKPPPTVGRTSNEPLPPLTEKDIGDGVKSKQKKKALPKYNASRPLGQR